MTCLLFHLPRTGQMLSTIITCSIIARKSFRLVRDVGERPLNTSQCDHALEPTDQSAAGTKVL